MYGLRGITNLYEGGTRSDYIVVAHPEYALGRVGSGRGFDQKWDQSKVATRPPGGPMTLRLRDAGAELLQRVTVPLQTLPNPRERVLAKKCSSAGRIGQKLPGLDQDFQAFLHVLRSVLGDAEPSHFRRTRDEDVQSRPLGYDGRLTSGYFNNITEAGVSSHRRQTHDCLLELARRYVSDPEAVACELRLNGSWRYWARELQLVLRQERKLFDQQRTKAETLELQLRMAALA
ncbi:Chorein_N domain-containing protein [Durusdinium trenchii]|uniref:Chorein_N domain-containing protein n=1 Tax=Durusdinium trenchii TaxID=1381693 RepID=A0ABP0IDU1_9DINO|eukprot:g870.t1